MPTLYRFGNRLDNSTTGDTLFFERIEWVNKGETKWEAKAVA